MSWQFYEIDRRAQMLVLNFRDDDVLGESHKMRMATAYGLERFWGEHLRLGREKNKKEQDKARFWKETWDQLFEIMRDAGITVPNDRINVNDKQSTDAIRAMAEKLWDENTFPPAQRKVALAVLTQLCDSLVWWTQRYKKPNGGNRNDG